MKNLFLGLGVVALLGSTASCKKDHTCECVTSTTAFGQTETSAPVSFTIKDTKKKAKNTCESYSTIKTSAIDPSITVTTKNTCTLK